MKTKSRICLVVALGIGAVGLLAGCSSMILGKPKTPENVPGLTVTSEQLRVRTRVMVKPLTGLFIEAFESIYDQTDDPAIRYVAVQFQTETVPAIREACFTPAPVVALLDTWALSFQLITYFESGPGAQALGEFAPVALAAAVKMNDYIEKAGYGLATDEVNEKADGIIGKWAVDNPIDPSIASRESINNQATKITKAMGLSLGDVVDTMISSVDDLNRKLDVYSDQIPKQARWEAELFTLGVLGDLELDQSLARVPELLDASKATLEVAQAMPEMVASERAVVLDAVRAEVAVSLETLQAERQAVMEQVARERQIVLAEVEVQRIAMTTDLIRERQALEAMVARERAIVINETEDLRTRLIEDIFIKALFILVLVGVYMALLVLAILWFVDRTSRRNEARTG